MQHATRNLMSSMKRMNQIPEDSYDNTNAVSNELDVRETLKQANKKAIYYQGKAAAYADQLGTLNHRFTHQHERLTNLQRDFEEVNGKYDRLEYKYESREDKHEKTVKHLQEDHEETVKHLQEELDEMGDCHLEAVGNLEEKIEYTKKYGQLCKCLTCLRNEAEWMFYPCGHIAFCTFCKANFLAEKLPNHLDTDDDEEFELPCSFCQQTCTEFIRVFLTGG